MVGIEAHRAWRRLLTLARPARAGPGAGRDARVPAGRDLAGHPVLGLAPGRRRGGAGPRRSPARPGWPAGWRPSARCPARRPTACCARCPASGRGRQPRSGSGPAATPTRSAWATITCRRWSAGRWRARSTDDAGMLALLAPYAGPALPGDAADRARRPGAAAPRAEDERPGLPGDLTGGPGSTVHVRTEGSTSRLPSLSLRSASAGPVAAPQPRVGTRPNARRRKRYCHQRRRATAASPVPLARARPRGPGGQPERPAPRPGQGQGRQVARPGRGRDPAAGARRRPGRRCWRTPAGCGTRGWRQPDAPA